MLRVRLVSASTPPRTWLGLGSGSGSGLGLGLGLAPPRTAAVPPRYGEAAAAVSEIRSEVRAAAASRGGARQRTRPSSARLATTWLGVGSGLG